MTQTAERRPTGKTDGAQETMATPHGTTRRTVPCQMFTGEWCTDCPAPPPGTVLAPAAGCAVCVVYRRCICAGA